MPYLNFTSGLLIYEDEHEKNPKVKLPDIEQSITKVMVGNDKSDRLSLSPGDVKDIIVTTRTISWDSTTQLIIERYLSTQDNVRIRWSGTGTNPAFTTNRNIGGDATTAVSITRVTPYVARVTQTGGTAWNLANVQVGDLVKFEKSTDAFTSPFSTANTGTAFKVQAKGANYIDFIDNGIAALDSSIVLGASFSFALRAYAPGPTKVGDTLEITGGTFNLANQGKFLIVDVSPDYIEIINAFVAPETILFTVNTAFVYEFLIGFIHLRSSDRIKIRFNAQTDWVVLDRLGAIAIMISSVCAYKIQAYNDGLGPVTISIQYAKVEGL